MVDVLSKSVFIHISKTGGSWIAKALKNANLVQTSGPRKYFQHFTIDEIETHLDVQNKKYFTFVRNPTTWYPSRWACNYNRYYFLHPPIPVNAPSAIRQLCDKTCIRNKKEFNNFNVWAKRVLSDHPSFLTNHYKYYLGNNYDSARKIGKIENLKSDLIKILKYFGEDFNKQKIQKTPPENESNNTLNRSWDKHLLTRVIYQNSDFMERFGYSTKVKDYQHLEKLV